MRAQHVCATFAQASDFFTWAHCYFNCCHNARSSFAKSFIHALICIDKTDTLNVLMHLFQRRYMYSWLSFSSLSHLIAPESQKYLCFGSQINKNALLVPPNDYFVVQGVHED